MKEVTIALAKGRLGDFSIELLEQCGLDCSELKDEGRKLIFYDRANVYRFLLAKPSDVPAYVEHGAADMGIVGKDTLMEADAPLYEMMDLKYAACSLCIAGYPQQNKRNVAMDNRVVATKYPNIARRYYQAKGETIDVIKLNGSIELAPLLGIADVILDIVQSGRTLKDNGLIVLEKICDISARLVVNRVSLKTKNERIGELMQKMRGIINGG
ncbi:MAG: ATP phosphoribosyltransferase [Christensenellales bacterium]|jgi:ATP phosphoribosyltransferase